MIKTPRLLFLIGIAAVILLIDYFTKWYVNAHLPLAVFSSQLYPYGGIPVFSDFLGIEFSIIHEINKGAAWGAFAEYQSYLMIARIILVIALLAYLFVFNRQRALDMPLTLIVTGAIGNVIDYFHYGFVVDMFRFTFWGYVYPIFNVADSAIFIGVVWILLQSLFSSGKTASTVNKQQPSKNK